jgi:hypothetical protein
LNNISTYIKATVHATTKIKTKISDERALIVAPLLEGSEVAVEVGAAVSELVAVTLPADPTNGVTFGWF